MTGLELQVLAVEREWWRHPGAKLKAIHSLGVTETRYYQLLNRLVDKPEAEALEPVLVHRLRRVRATAKRRAA